MAGNMKGQGGLKGALLKHGEKAAMAVVGLIAMWLLYKTTSLPRLEEKYKAPKLHEAISQTSNAVHSAQWPEPGSPQANEVLPFVPIDAKADVAVDSQQYKISPGGVDPTIITPTILRTDPQLLNAVDVRATGGSGLFAFSDEKTRKDREQAKAAEDAERAKKEQDKAEKEAKSPTQPGAPGRKPGQQPGASVEPYDPAHPKRRPVEGGMARSLGVPLQGGERIERAYWATVVAKVPIREQLKLYQDAFEKAKGGFDPTRDFPQYKGYLVQRAEVVPGKEITKDDWKPVPVTDGQHQAAAGNKPLNADGAMSASVMNELQSHAQQFWAGQMPDVVDARFTDYVLTFPLPPLVGRDWGAEATHPDIPLLVDTPPLEQEAPISPPTATPEQPAEGDVFGAAPANVGPGAPGSVPGFSAGRPVGTPGFGPRSGGPGSLGPGAMIGRFRPGVPGGAGPEGARPSYAGAGPGAQGSRTSLPKGVDYLLLRFFDFTVEPGKKYEYRVTLVIVDPNYNLADNYLAPAVLDRHRQESQAARAKSRPRPDFRRLEAWSEPSPKVGIPLSGGAKLVDVKIPSAEKFNDEPSAKLLVESFDTDEKGNAIQAAKDQEFRRGNVANMVDKVEYLVDGGAAIDTRDNFKFITGMTLLDIDGGKKLSKDMSSPGRVMLMGPAGELYIHNELDDKPAVEYHKALFDKHAGEGPDVGGPGRPPRGGPMPGRGRPGGP